MAYETAQEIFDALCEPFPVEYISWRIGATRQPYEGEVKDGKAKPDDKMGKPICYVDARAVMDRLDTVCGPDGWQDTYTPGLANSIVCNIGVRMPSGDWLWKADGAGATDVEGEKGMLSDAFKRAGVRWGISRYLYDLDAPWIVLQRQKFISKDSERALNELHEDFAQKCGWGFRSGIQAYKLLNQVMKSFVTTPADALEFRDANKSMIVQLPVAMRRHLEATLDRVGATAREAAE
ncbi:DNA damage response protein A [Afipia felis]|uniref:DNA damage response protein A n=1 Tax=Afipia felis TaxID=1035 RepID=A0A090MR82_AFIFE|nr:Rad52/Rad22 family DNA repair protein [Afipia felis]CEG08752.1 DNA damage response protein A [Afipia felis]